MQTRLAKLILLFYTFTNIIGIYAGKEDGTLTSGGKGEDDDPKDSDGKYIIDRYLPFTNRMKDKRQELYLVCYSDCHKSYSSVVSLLLSQFREYMWFYFHRIWRIP